MSTYGTVVFSAVVVVRDRLWTLRRGMARGPWSASVTHAIIPWTRHGGGRRDTYEMEEEDRDDEWTFEPSHVLSPSVWRPRTNCLRASTSCSLTLNGYSVNLTRTDSVYESLSAAFTLCSVSARCLRRRTSSLFALHSWQNRG